MKFDKSSMSESLMNKTLANWVMFLFVPLKIIIIVELSCGHKHLEMYSFSLTTGVHGFNVYKGAWEPTIAEISFV